MSSPLIHAKSSIKRWGGTVEDYLPIHENLDNVKGTGHNLTARLITHNGYYCYNVIPKIFGYEIINSAGKRVDTTDIALLHVAEDYRMKGVPSIQDIVQHIEIQPWMMNGVKPIPSEGSKKEVDELLKRIE